MQFAEPERPILLLDSAQCRKNIRSMAEKCRKSSCRFRPHFKTHQSIQIGRWFRNQGVSGITVSTPDMAAYFADDGWDDITIAFPFYRAQLTSIKKIQDKANLRLFIHNEKDLLFLQNELEKSISFYIELDNGYNRSGISPSNRGTIDGIVETASTLSRVHFHGFYMHDGRTYQSRSVDDILKSIESSIQMMKQMKKNYPDAIISFGDTPSASVLPSFDYLDECTAGNFIFYDWMQYRIGSCSLNDIALFHILPMAQTFPDEHRAICHGGAVHCSKDYIYDGDESKNYGQMASFDKGEPVKILDGKLESLSQEHGMLTVGARSKHTLLNNSVCIIPIHSCLTANLYDRYYTTNGEIIKKRMLS